MRLYFRYGQWWRLKQECYKTGQFLPFRLGSILISNAFMVMREVPVLILIVTRGVFIVIQEGPTLIFTVFSEVHTFVFTVSGRIIFRIFIAFGEVRTLVFIVIAIWILVVA